MNNQRLISFDIQADFGFFKKPDYNDGVLLTYNMLHKPALLGILGAIIGLRGYRKKGEWPEYYQRLAALPVGIEPLEGRHEKGSFQKTIVKYTNTVGYANQDGNLLVEESMLIRPATHFAGFFRFIVPFTSRIYSPDHCCDSVSDCFYSVPGDPPFDFCRKFVCLVPFVFCFVIGFGNDFGQ